MSWPRYVKYQVANNKDTPSPVAKKVTGLLRQIFVPIKY